MTRTSTSRQPQYDDSAIPSDVKEHSKVAAVRWVGGIATIMRVSPASALNVNVRLFVKPRSGLLVVDPSLQTFVMAPNRQSLNNLETSISGMLRTGQLPSEHRRGHW